LIECDRIAQGIIRWLVPYIWSRLWNEKQLANHEPARTYTRASLRVKLYL